MNLVRNYPVCEGCIHSSLLHCNKFNKECLSVSFGVDRHQLVCLDCLNEDSYEFGYTEEKKYEGLIACMHMPGPEHFDLFKSMIKFQEFYPEACYPNRKITEIYGAFPGAIWNGRTTDYGQKTMTIQEIDIFRQDAEALGLSVNLTWNNHLVSGTDVYDRTCNAITEVFNNGKHSITVASKELFDYLKDKYPNFKYYQSVITTSNDKEFTKKDPRFDFYLMNRNLNNNWEVLSKIPEEDRSSIEFLCNDICTPICNRMGHYNIVNACLLNRSDETCLGTYCTIDHDFSQYNMKRWPMTINPSDIDKYLENGYCHFKICGRWENDIDIAMKLANYMVKPEFVEDAIYWLMAKRTQTEKMRKVEIYDAIKEAKLTLEGKNK